MSAPVYDGIVYWPAPTFAYWVPTGRPETVGLVWSRNIVHEIVIEFVAASVQVTDSAFVPGESVEPEPAAGAQVGATPELSALVYDGIEYAAVFV